MNNQSKSLLITIGVSLVTNYLKEKGSKALKNTWSDVEDLDSYEKLEEDATLKKQVDKLKNYIKDWAEGNPDSCAEFKTLKLFGPVAKIYLLRSDTVEGQLVGQMLQGLLSIEKPEITVSPHSIEAANVKIPKIFEKKGVHNLIEKVKDIYKQEIKKNRKLSIAYSGGYKAFIPPLTLFAQLKQLDMVYVYVDSTTPITTGHIPSAFDWSFAEQIYPLLAKDALEELSKHPKNETLLSKLRDMSLIVEPPPTDGGRWLTPIGQLYTHHIQDNSPNGKSTLGFYMEYKVLEFLYDLKLEKEQSNDKKFTDIERSVRYPIGSPNWVIKDGKKIDQRPEVDFILRRKKGNMAYEAVEVKSVYRYLKSKRQFTKQLDAMLNQYGNAPKKYTYALYQFDFLDKHYEDRILAHKKDLEQFLNQTYPQTKISLDVHLLNIPFDFVSGNAYKEFMKGKLSDLGTVQK